ATRREARTFRDLVDADLLRHSLNPLAASPLNVVDYWCTRLGPVSFLQDEHAVLTDKMLDNFVKISRLRIPGMKAALPLRSWVRGSSANHPSIQLADLISGAGRAVARRHAGYSSPEAEVLWPAVVPLITEDGMLPYDGPIRFDKI